MMKCNNKARKHGIMPTKDGLTVSA